MPGRASNPPDGPPVDEVDRRLLEVLVADGRISVNELANRASVSRATAYSRFDRLRDSGVVTGFHAEVDPRALGYSLAALVLVTVEQGAWKDLRTELVRLPGVEYVALTSGPFDFVLLVRFADVAELRDVVLVHLQGMAQVRSTETILVLDEVRRRLI